MKFEQDKYDRGIAAEKKQAARSLNAQKVKYEKELGDLSIAFEDKLKDKDKIIEVTFK